MAYQPLSSISGLYGSLSTKPPIQSTVMGVKAKSPTDNTAAAINAIPSSQAQVATPSNAPKPTITPPVTSQPTPNRAPAPTAQPAPAPASAGATPTTYPGLISSLANTSQNSPQVDKANNDLLNFQKGYANYQNAVGTEANPFGFETGVGQLAQNRYAQELPAYQQAIQNALTGRSQSISGLGTAAGLAAPTQVSPGNFFVNPQTGQDVSGGTISPGIGGARQAQVAQGAAGQTNIPKINAAAGYVNTFNNLLSSSGLQQSDLNVGNLINNLYASNTSNPAYPQLQTSFNNAINFYSQVLGQDPNQLVTSLASTGRGSTVSSLLQNLDKEARDYNSQVQSASTGTSPTVSVQPQPATPAPTPATGATSGVTPGGIKYTVISQ